MCTNMRWIVNQYTRKRILVKCGHCPACMVEKAHHRAGRIKNNVYDGELTLFCTLTYANECLPYIKLSDLLECKRELTIYRDSSVRRVRVSGDYEMKYKVTLGTKELDTVTMDEDFYKQMDGFTFVAANNKPGCVSVCYYKDIQDFFKRLDINLKRRYGFKGHYSRFACQEYGGKRKRSHFHLAVSCKAVDLQTIQSAICEAWPFDRGKARHRKCELAKGSIANYVADYVNSFAAFHPLLSSHNFRSKCSYSRGYGLAPVDFDVDRICDKASQGRLDWSFETLVQRVPTLVNVSIPKYVINRYFPKFKGYSRLASSQVLDILHNPHELIRYRRILEYSDDDLKREVVKLKNAKKRYRYPLRFEHDYIMVWSAHSRTVLAKFYESLTNTQYDYDNICLLLKRPFMNRSLLPLFLRTDSDSLNPNNYPENKKKEMLLLDEFRTRQKHREINQLYFEANNHEQLM